VGWGLLRLAQQGRIALLSSITKKMFGTKNTRVLKFLRPIVGQIGAFERQPLAAHRPDRDA
jgi:hypothetical protein